MSPNERFLNTSCVFAQQFLQDNRDVFAWQPADMPGVPRELAEHKLKVYPQARLIRQKLHRFTPDKREAIHAELARLVAAGFIREVLHPEWLANPVLVRKKGGKWRMCVVKRTYLHHA